MTRILAREQQILAQLAIVLGRESGEPLEVQGQVAFMCKTDHVSNGGERPVRSRKQQLGSLNAPLNDIAVGGKANGLLEEAREVVGAPMHDCCEIGEREILRFLSFLSILSFCAWT